MKMERDLGFALARCGVGIVPLVTVYSSLHYSYFGNEFVYVYV